MIKAVSITSQGQITIPAKMRRALGLKKFEKALVKLEGEKITVEPVPDLLSLGGSLKEYALKDKSISEIIAAEEKAVLKKSSQEGSK